MENLRRMKQCPRFNSCSCPICPLDEDKSERIYVSDEPKCNLSKSLRMKFGRDLPWKGLFPKELAGYKSWHSKSENNKLKIVQLLATTGSKNRFAPRVVNEKKK